MTNRSPSSSPEASLACAECGKNSSSSQRYCVECGHLLWDPCLECGKSNPSTIAYCGDCGSDLPQALEKAKCDLREALCNADTQASNGYYLDALECLHEIELIDHSQLQDLTNTIRERIERFPGLRDKAIEASSKAYEDASSLASERQWKKAFALLSKVLPAFRGRNHNELLETVSVRVKEAKQLRERIAVALKTNSLEGLLPKVQRLGELDPDDTEVQGLILQLRGQQQRKFHKESRNLLHKAKVALKQCDYKKARKCLDQLPETQSSPENATLIQAIKERVWLAEQLSVEPYVSSTLCAIANRLLKLQPHDTRLATVAKQLHSKWQKASREQSGTPVPWLQDGRSSLADFTFFALPKELSQSDIISPEGMLLAFGLALQGLDKADISLNLAPKESKKGSWFGRVSVGKQNNTTRRAWGIDIGSRNLKALQLELDEQDDSIHVTQAVVLPLPFPSKSTVSELASTEEVVGQFLNQHSLNGETVVINLPGTHTLHRFFDLPAPKPKKFFEAVEFELRSQIPLEPGLLFYDYHWFDLPVKKKAMPQRRVMLAAAKRIQVEQRLRAFEGAGISRLVVQGDCIALCNAVSHVMPGNSRQGAIAVLEIGSESCNMVVLNGSTLWVRGYFAGAGAFDRRVSDHYKSTLSEAETMCCQPETLPVMHELFEVLQPEFENFAEEFQRTLARYHTEAHGSVSQILLCGAGSQRFGLLKYLRSQNCSG